MLQVRRRPVIALLVAGVIGAAVIPASTAGAATITACVKSKTGEMRLAKKKKTKKKKKVRECPRGWRRVRWNSRGSTGKRGKQGKPGTRGVAGAPGAPGAPGTQGLQGITAPPLNVKDAGGAVVGQFMGLLPQGVPFYAVLRDGGFFYYLGSGQVYPIGSPNWKTSDCSGTAYMGGSSGLGSASFALLVSGPFRMAFRTVSAGAFGPTSAWKGRGTTEAVVNVQLYDRDSSTGACQLDGGLYTGDLAPLDPVAAPPDFTGPLTVG